MLAAKATVRRCLIGSLVQQLIADPVAEAADGLQRRTAEGPVDLVAQGADVDVHDPGIALEGEVPDVLDERPPRQDIIRAAHQAFEQRELGRREVDPGPDPAYLVPRGIQAQVTDAENRGTLRRGPAPQGPQPGQE